ncbi:2-amino-4-hydroxy-6-hydroxymethyldihydropteridine diphosphokinase [Piscinibacter terrae]|uniref:2-amino-4-hydroxy-6- hydroxymethyldihydropteridine diphosphokinase n=1 Tax=Piscinibacter terrae TaxID=2496871 RepID=UPI001F39F880|nr:2-amino-4-hydroxy-6-hydroxymethyldihydropteridine diphosphokinase [Albitalea terrae]
MRELDDAPQDSGVQACIALGANLGDALATLQAAERALSELPGTTLLAVSPIYRTAPIDATGPDYLNGVALVRTSLDAHGLLRHLQAIEQRHGRQRSTRNAPRTLDLDLLLYGDQAMHGDDLTVPHPRMHERAFVLRPLLDVAPSIRIPGLGPASDWLPRVADQRIERLNP